MAENSHAASRQQMGCKIGLVILAGNMGLVIIKLVIGFMSGSAAVLSDGFNNLADCISSIITIAGFRLSARPKDKNHPYGHGRMEYISGLVISILIIITAVTFGKLAFYRIQNPQTVIVYPIMLLFIAFAIMVKLALVLYAMQKNKTIKSPSTAASIKDSFSDAAITAITLLSLIIMPYTNFPLDGLAALIVVGFIMWGGITSFIENTSLLLGVGASKELSKDVEDIVLKYDAVDSVTNLEVHDYGPQSRIATMQISLNQDIHSNNVQETLAWIKGELKTMLGLDVTVYIN
jgi:cation diffusion facilitator family transporter